MHLPDGVSVDGRIDLQRAQGIEHHLRVGLGLHQDAGSILIVHHAHPARADDDAVRSTKALGHVVPEVHPGLQGHEGLHGAVRHGQSLQVLQIGVCGGIHALVVVGILFQLLQPGVERRLLMGSTKYFRAFSSAMAWANVPAAAYSLAVSGNCSPSRAEGGHISHRSALLAPRRACFSGGIRASPPVPAAPWRRRPAALASAV